jgi:hypothetical protein
MCSIQQYPYFFNVVKRLCFWSNCVCNKPSKFSHFMTHDVSQILRSWYSNRPKKFSPQLKRCFPSSFFIISVYFGLSNDLCSSNFQTRMIPFKEYDLPSHIEDRCSVHTCWPRSKVRLAAYSGQLFCWPFPTDVLTENRRKEFQSSIPK